MLVFKSNVSHTRIYFLARFTFSLIVGFGLLFAFKYFGLIRNIPPVIWSALVVSLITDFVKRSRAMIINQIIIDTEKRIVTFDCFQFWQKQVQFIDPFEELKVEIVIQKPTWLYHSPLIFFFKNYPGQFYVSRRKDHFSKKMLANLVLALGQLTSPASRTS